MSDGKLSNAPDPYVLQTLEEAGAVKFENQARKEYLLCPKCCQMIHEPVGEQYCWMFKEGVMQITTRWKNAPQNTKRLKINKNRRTTSLSEYSRRSTEKSKPARCSSRLSTLRQGMMNWPWREPNQPQTGYTS